MSNNIALLRIRKILTAFLIAVCLIGGIDGCGLKVDTGAGANQTENETETEGLIVVGFSQVGSESMWRTANTNSIQGALTEDDGYFLIFNNARQKQENQIKAIRQYISRRVDFIVFSPVTEDGWENVLQEAKRAGIPVIMVDRKAKVSDPSLYMTWIGSDMEEEGRKAGIWLEQYEHENHLSRENINIVVLQGTEGATSTIGRTEGFHEIADKHSNWTILEEVSADYTTAKGKEVMDGLIAKYDSIDVVISQNDDMTLGVISALDEAGITYGLGGDIALCSFDATREALLLVQQGLINVDIECNPIQGEYVEHTIWSYLQGFTILKSTVVEENVFTIDNVGEYIEERVY